jgi:hypothetical protein
MRLGPVNAHGTASCTPASGASRVALAATSTQAPDALQRAVIGAPLGLHAFAEVQVLPRRVEKQASMSSYLSKVEPPLSGTLVGASAQLGEGPAAAAVAPPPPMS